MSAFLKGLMGGPAKPPPSSGGSAEDRKSEQARAAMSKIKVRQNAFALARRARLLL